MENRSTRYRGTTRQPLGQLPGTKQQPERRPLTSIDNRSNLALGPSLQSTKDFSIYLDSTKDRPVATRQAVAAARPVNDIENQIPHQLPRGNNKKIQPVFAPTKSQVPTPYVSSRHLVGTPESCMSIDEQPSSLEEEASPSEALDHSMASLPEEESPLRLVLDSLPSVETSSYQKYNSRCSEEFASESWTLTSTYLDDIYPYMLQREKKLRPMPHYMKKQGDISHHMRSILVDWLVEVAKEYMFNDETLYLAINFVDRFLSCMSIIRSKFQLLGTAAILVAAKFEEIYTPGIKQYVEITDKTYTQAQLMKMEHLVLKVLHFDLSVPTPLFFLRVFQAVEPVPQMVEFLARYLCELTLLDGEAFLKFLSSEIAACAYMLANFSMGRIFVWSDKLAQFSGYSLDKVKDCMTLLHHTYLNSAQHSQQAIRTKYLSAKFQRVGSLNPPHSLPLWN